MSSMICLLVSGMCSRFRESANRDEIVDPGGFLCKREASWMHSAASSELQNYASARAGGLAAYPTDGLADVLHDLPLTIPYSRLTARCESWRDKYFGDRPMHNRVRRRMTPLSHADLPEEPVPSPWVPSVVRTGT